MEKERTGLVKHLYFEKGIPTQNIQEQMRKTVGNIQRT